MTTKQPSPLLLVFIALNLLMVGAVLTISPTAWKVQTAAATDRRLTPTETLQLRLAPLVQQATAIVYGTITEQQSQWNADHTQIETTFTLAVAHTLTGEVADQLQVRVPGGYLADEGIGMWSSHVAPLATGQAVLLFLKQEGRSYSVVLGEQGQFTLTAELLTNHALALNVPPALLESTLAQAISKQGRTVTFSSPALFQTFAAKPSNQALQSKSNQPFSDLTPTWPETTILEQININSDQVGDRIAEFRAAIGRALRTWSVVTDANFTLLDDGSTPATATGYDGVNQILFMHKGANNQLGQAQIWYTSDGTILEADIWINDDYVFSVTDTPAVSQVDLESVVLHELGHWIPLEHSPDPTAVMYAVLNASTKRVLQSDDTGRLVQVYPCAEPPCINEIYLGPTPTLIPTVTPTLIPTSEPTATLIPTQQPTGIESTIYLPFVIR